MLQRIGRQKEKNNATCCRSDARVAEPTLGSACEKKTIRPHLDSNETLAIKWNQLFYYVFVFDLFRLRVRRAVIEHAPIFQN